MQKSKSILRGFFTAHFFKHSAGIAAFMLFTLSLMSFRYDEKIDKTARTNKKDSLSNIQNFAGLLVGDLTEEPVADRSIFKLRPEMKVFVTSFAKKEKDDYNNMKDWGKPYFDLYDKILAENGLPVELKYLSVIESGLQGNNKTSGAYGTAAGPWQIMPDEAKRFGLKMKKGYDERMNFTKATYVASQLLKELYAEYGDWLMVIAAYNCGMGRMHKAITLAKSNNYWKLEKYLPAETRSHVKKFIATHYFFEGAGGWTTITSAEAVDCRTQLAKANEAKTRAYINSIAASEINGRYSAAAIIRTLAIDADLFNKLNPAFDKTITEGKSYSLKLPQSKMPLFLTNRQQILEQSAQTTL